MVKKKHCDSYKFLLHNLSEILPDPSPKFSIHRPCHDKLKVLILRICALSEHFYIFQPLSPFWIHLPQNKVIKNVSLDLRLFFFVFLGVKFALFLFKCSVFFVSELFPTILVSNLTDHSKLLSPRDSAAALIQDILFSVRVTISVDFVVSFMQIMQM